MKFKPPITPNQSKRASSPFPEDFKRGMELHKLGNYIEAIEYYDKAIRLNSKISEIHYSRGVALRKMNNNSAAIKSYEVALQIRANYPEAHYNMANILRDNGNYENALSRYNDAIKFNSKYAEAYFNRGLTFKALNQFDEALKDYDSAILYKPDYAQAFYNKGNMLIELGSFELAVESFNNAIFIDPNKAEYHYNRANAQREALRLDDALNSYGEAIKIRPNYADAFSNRGATLHRLKRFNDALEDFSCAQSIEPENPETHWNESLCRLAIGDFEQGWDHYEWRLKEKSFQKNSIIARGNSVPTFSVKNSRSDLHGKALFIASEQGIGDHIMFMSILSDLLRDTSQVTCQIDPRLIRLFSRCFSEIKFIPHGNIRDADTINVDRFIRLGSLGFTYRKNVSDFPGTPYISADPARVADWRLRISSESSRLKVGISWRGGSDNTNGKDRSMALDQMTSLFANEDCTFVSLQYGEVEAEVAAFNATRSRKLHCFKRQEIEDFEDFVGLIGALDCVVSVQNTTVHTCGALGKPCFAMLPFRPEWRYGASGTTMPWYGSVKLFRQAYDREWSDVIKSANEELNRILK